MVRSPPIVPFLDRPGPPAAAEPSSPFGGTPRRRELWLAAAAVLGAALFHLLYINHGVRNWIDLGVAATDGERILRGDVFGRDFLAPYGPGRYYLTALWFALFGASLFSLNMLFLCLMAVTDFLAYLVARRFLPPFGAMIALFLTAVAHGPVHKVYIGLFSSLFFWAALRALERRSFSSGLLMGLTGAAAGLFRYDIGVLSAFLGLFVVAAAALPGLGGPALFKDREEGPEAGPAKGGALPGGAAQPKGAGLLAAGFAAGGALICLPAAALLFAFLDPGWIIGGIVHRIRVFDSVRVAEKGLFSLFASGGWENFFKAAVTALFIAAPFAALLCGGRGVFLRRKGLPALRLLLLGAAGVFLLNQWRLIPRVVRLMQGGPLLYTAMVFFALRLKLPARPARLARLWAKAPLPGAILLAASMGLYVWTCTGEQSQDSVAVLRFDERFMDIDRAGCWVRPKRCLEMERVVARVRSLTEPGEPVLAGPACPIVPFLAGRPTPAPFSDPYLYFLSEEEQKRMIRAVASSRVRLFVDWPRPIGGLSLAGAAPLLYGEIGKTFTRVERAGRFVILTRR